MDMIGKAWRMKLRDQLSDGEICRRTGLARNTVKKWLKAPGDITLKYERKKAKNDLSPERALVQLRRIQRHSVRINNGDPISGVSTINTQQSSLYAALNLKKPTADAQLSLL